MKTITFFLVDDDADDTLVFEEVLQEAAPAVALQTAVNGQEALQKLRNGEANLPDLLFLDLNMPRMGGKECLHELKADDRLRQIPVIMYTTSSQSRDIEETMMSGAICFVTKPSHTKELRYILSSIANSLPHNLERTLRTLSNNANTFIVC